MTTQTLTAPTIPPNLSRSEKLELLALLEERDRRQIMKRARQGALAPQAGPQMQFLECQADIAIYGGAAGGGKTWALLLEPLKHIDNGEFEAVFFRRNTTQITNPGGLWDESYKLYPSKDGDPNSKLFWTFPSGARVTFKHLEHEKTVLEWQGSQITLICYDELTHFTESQFWYLLSRNRSLCGVKPYIRATTNPDADSWVATLIAWWIDQDTGLPIPSRAGAIRWFVRVGDKLIWADDAEKLKGYTLPNGDPIPPKSMTFIPSKLSDNRVLMIGDPAYQTNLMALPTVERERLLRGNWKVKHKGQAFFDMANLYVDGKPVPPPQRCDEVWCILDCATKTGKKHDGTAALFGARTRAGAYPHPVAILDWDYQQIEGALLIDWLPALWKMGEEWARRVGARRGFLGFWIEDQDAGKILLQQCRRPSREFPRGIPAYPIPGDLTAKGKDERALGVSGDVALGKVKMTQHAYDKTVVFKDVSKNHLIDQIENFQIADPDAAKRADDLLDDFTYLVALSCETGRLE